MFFESQHNNNNCRLMTKFMKETEHPMSPLILEFQFFVKNKCGLLISIKENPLENCESIEK